MIHKLQDGTKISASIW